MVNSALSVLLATENQRKTYWDFFFVDNPLIRYRIKSCTLPLYQFEFETRSTLENFYKSIKITPSFNVEIYEDITFGTYSYFKIWMNSVYNFRTKTFISYPNTTSEISPIYKTAIFQYYGIGGVVDTPPNKVFTLINVKLVGLGDLQNTYEDGSALTYSVTCTFDDMIDI